MSIHVTLTEGLVEFVLDNHDLIRRAVTSLSGADRAQAERVLADGILNILMDSVHEQHTKTPLLPLAAAVAAATQEIWNSMLGSVTNNMPAPDDQRRIVFFARTETDFERILRQHATPTRGDT